MKSFLALFLFTIAIYAQSVKWQGGYQKALELAKKSDKKLLVLVIKKENRDVVRDYFTNKKYVEHINKNYVSVIALFDSRRSYPIEMYYTTIFPTFFLVDPKNETFIIEPLYGKKSLQRLSLVLGQ